MRPILAFVFMTALIADRPAGATEAPAPAGAGESPVIAPEAPQAGAMTSAGLIALADSVQGEVEMLRGWAFRRPVAKDVRSPEQLHAFLLETLDREYPGDRFARVQAFLRTVGLLPDSVDLESTLVSLLMNQVAGFYDPATRGFTMVNLDGLRFPPAMVRILIAHELTHALDDQYVNLDSLLYAVEPTEDAQFAVTAVAEGSAMELMTRYMARMQLTGAVSAEELAEVMRSEMERSRPFLESPPYFASIVGRYMCGMWFLLRDDVMGLLRVNGDSGVGEVLPRVWTRLPRSSEQILHQEKYWDEASRDEPVIVDDAAMRGVLERLELSVTHTNTVGEALCAVLTRAPSDGFSMMTAASASAWTNAAGSGWGGDRFYLLAGGVGGAAVAADGSSGAAARGVWITAWDTPLDRDEFIAAYAAVAEARGAEVTLLGERSAVVLYGFNAAAGSVGLDAIRAAVEALPSPLWQAGRPVAW